MVLIYLQSGSQQQKQTLGPRILPILAYPAVLVPTSPDHTLPYQTPPSLAVDNVLFSFRVASSDGLGSFRVVSGGNGCDDYATDLSGIVSVPPTGGNMRFINLEV